MNNHFYFTSVSHEIFIYSKHLLLCFLYSLIVKDMHKSHFNGHHPFNFSCDIETEIVE